MIRMIYITVGRISKTTPHWRLGQTICRKTGAFCEIRGSPNGPKQDICVYLMSSFTLKDKRGHKYIRLRFKEI